MDAMAMLEAQQDAASGRGERSVEADKARTPTPTALPPPPELFDAFQRAAARRTAAQGEGASESAARGLVSETGEPPQPDRGDNAGAAERKARGGAPAPPDPVPHGAVGCAQGTALPPAPLDPLARLLARQSKTVMVDVPRERTARSERPMPAPQPFAHDYEAGRDQAALARKRRRAASVAGSAPQRSASGPHDVETDEPLQVQHEHRATR